MAVYKNWRSGTYRFSHTTKDYTYPELKRFFRIDGSEVVYCTKDFGQCKAGRYYLVSPGSWCGCGFVVHNNPTSFGNTLMDAGFESWESRKYLATQEAAI